MPFSYSSPNSSTVYDPALPRGCWCARPLRTLKAGLCGAGFVACGAALAAPGVSPLTGRPGPLSLCGRFVTLFFYALNRLEPPSPPPPFSPWNPAGVLFVAGLTHARVCARATADELPWGGKVPMPVPFEPWCPMPSEDARVSDPGRSVFCASQCRGHRAPFFTLSHASQQRPVPVRPVGAPVSALRRVH